jgi:transposase InsO family protein
VGGVRRLYLRWGARHRVGAAPPFARRRAGWNRTPAHVEEKVVRLHVEQPLLGTGQLRLLAARVLGFRAARETFRNILSRRRELIVALEDERRKPRRRITVSGPRKLWGADLTLVFVLGFFPCWVLGVVDYWGSRVVAFERVAWPTAACVARALEAAFERHGAPDRLLTDRGPQFRAEQMAQLLIRCGVTHTLTRPAHPWTSGRIERLFRTFKETVFARFWLIASVRQLDRFCSDFVRWHNRDRPHSGWGGRTPDEVHLGRRPRRALGRVRYFDGRLDWFRFG